MQSVYALKIFLHGLSKMYVIYFKTVPALQLFCSSSRLCNLVLLLLAGHRGTTYLLDVSTLVVRTYQGSFLHSQVGFERLIFLRSTPQGCTR